MPAGSLDVATLHDLKICPEDTGHPTPAGLSSREGLQTRAFSLIQTQSLSKLARVAAKICSRRGNGGVPGPCLRALLPVMKPE